MDVGYSDGGVAFNVVLRQCKRAHNVVVFFAEGKKSSNFYLGLFDVWAFSRQRCDVFAVRSCGIGSGQADFPVIKMGTNKSLLGLYVSIRLFVYTVIKLNDMTVLKVLFT